MASYFKKYIRLWWRLAGMAAGSYLSSRIDSLSYFFGKIVRFTFFMILIFAIFRFTDSLAGYAKYEVILFFLTFNLLDVLAQAMFRGIYLIKNDIRSGGFDHLLVKPVNALFYSLSRLTDILDLIFLAPILAFLVFTIMKLEIAISMVNIAGYLIFLFLGFLIILGIHILSACISVWALEAEGFIWLYRDIMTLSRFPPEIYSPKIQFIFIYIIPVLLAVSFPAKAALGIVTLKMFLAAVPISLAFFCGSLLLWNISLKNYSSISS